ncbi:hypothetical protein C2845_PM03G27450, partial [Panicum miliaceum]
YPPSGFTNFLQSKNTLESFHLVGNTISRSRVSPSAPSFKGTPPSKSNAQDIETINVDADETIEDGRTEKRLNWTKDEDIRLASAWVHNSKDPVDGTDNKSDQYWADVTEEYNKTTEMYASEHSDKEFMLKHIWKVVRGERKWFAYVKKMEHEKEKNKGTTNSPTAMVNLEDNPNIRPIGHKRAKGELFGKKKIPEAYSAISEKLDKFIEVSTLARKDREKMSKTQQNLANSKVEASRLNEKAAEKQLT